MNSQELVIKCEHCENWLHIFFRNRKLIRTKPRQSIYIAPLTVQGDPAKALLSLRARIM